ncbi:MAG: hypothetical protein Q4Q14_05980 [Methanobrevibacter sp.]|nr:hypothetical protein [Methanobrevibacter sp.]
MYKKMLIVSLLVFLTLGVASASENVTDDAGEINEDDSISSDVERSGIFEDSHLGDANGSAVKTFDDIQGAVDKAQSKDIIKLEGEYVSCGNSIKVNKDLTIVGSNDTILKANGKSGGFQIDRYSSIVFKNLRIVDAFQAICSESGYDFLYSGNITCINCTFINCSHPESRFGDGGAIRTGALLAVIDCSFINCSSSFSGGAVHCYYGIFNNSTFVNNSIANLDDDIRYGGAISGHDLRLSDCIFINNDAGYGGAVYCSESGLDCSNCKFSNNHAEGYGGAICIYSKFAMDSGYKFVVVNSEFSNNTADYQDIELAQSYKMTYMDWGDGSLFTYYHTYVELKYLLKNCRDLYKTHFTPVVITAPKLTATYDSGKVFKFKVTDKKTKKTIRNAAICIKVTLPKKYYSTFSKLNKDFPYWGIIQETEKNFVISIAIYTDSNGIASLKFNHPVGSYKIEVFPAYLNYTSSKVSSTIKISKSPTTIKAPKVTAKYKKSKYFKVTVKNKATKKVVKNIKVKIKVYTGKKYKTFSVKTNNKGMAKLNTKKLKKGTHKVVISSGNSNYKISAKSTIKIK